jgi:hypothetical protein
MVKNANRSCVRKSNFGRYAGALGCLLFLLSIRLAVAASKDDGFEVLSSAALVVQLQTKQLPDDWSYRITFLHGSHRIFTEVVDFRNGRSSVTSADSQTIDVAPFSYMKDLRTGKWTKFDDRTLPAAFVSTVGGSRIRAHKHLEARMKLLPNSSTLNSTVGTATVTLPSNHTSVATRKIRCVYEKTTYRVRSCTEGADSLRFDHYNALANRIVVPAAALHAPAVDIRVK